MLASRGYYIQQENITIKNNIQQSGKHLYAKFFLDTLM